MTTDLTTRPDLIETKRHRIRKWVLRAGLVLAVLGPLVFLIASLGYRWGLMDLGTALGTLTFKIGPPVLMLGAAVGILGLILSIFVQPRRGIGLAIIAIAIPLAGLMKAGSIRKTAQSLPYIHDITTDTQNPPKFTQNLVDIRKESGASNSVDYIGKKDKEGGKLVSVLQTKAYPDIRPILTESEPSIVFGEALMLVKQQGWDIVTEDASAGIIEATDTTFWFGFKDDVIIRIRAGEGGGSIIDMRSVSRVGQSDIGKNADRLRELMKGLEKG